MTIDDYGFCFPYINTDKCVECGICLKVCAFKKFIDTSFPIRVYGGVSNNRNILLQSSSGGIFYHIAEEIINKNGIVYGVSYNSELKPCHIRIKQIEDLKVLQNSKYAQSDTRYTYSEVKEDLDKEYLVLYSGTPCQIAGLISFLGKRPTKLITVDIVCHGVPSAEWFAGYLNVLKSNNKGDLIEFKFREKIKGWYCNASAQFLQGRKERRLLLPVHESSYYQFFMDSSIYRDSCYSCRFSNPSRPGDITLGDYWGVDVIQPEAIKSLGLDINFGVSIILVNTVRGLEMIEYCKNALTLFDSTYEMVSKHNGQLNHPAKLTQERKVLLCMYHEHGYKGVDEYYKSKYKKYIIKQRIKNIIPNKVKLFIKNAKNR